MFMTPDPVQDMFVTLRVAQIVLVKRLQRENCLAWETN
jgi:hypothetical protein